MLRTFRTDAADAVSLEAELWGGVGIFCYQHGPRREMANWEA